MREIDLQIQSKSTCVYVLFFSHLILSWQNFKNISDETDKLDDRIQVFFHQCKRQRTDWKNENYEEIRRVYSHVLLFWSLEQKISKFLYSLKEYLKLLESAEDKVQIANQLYDLVINLNWNVNLNDLISHIYLWNN